MKIPWATPCSQTLFWRSGIPMVKMTDKDFCISGPHWRQPSSRLWSGWSRSLVGIIRDNLMGKWWGCILFLDKCVRKASFTLHWLSKSCKLVNRVWDFQTLSSRTFPDRGREGKGSACQNDSHKGHCSDPQVPQSPGRGKASHSRVAWTQGVKQWGGHRIDQHNTELLLLFMDCSNAAHGQRRQQNHFQTVH